jgi:hypothetical protein
MIYSESRATRAVKRMLMMEVDEDRRAAFVLLPVEEEEGIAKRGPVEEEV